MIKVIGLDLATTAGVAISDWKSNRIHVYSIEGDPHEQLLLLSTLIDITIPNLYLIEDFVYFGRNKVAAKSLMKRAGYFEYTLQSYGNEVQYLHPQAARKFVKGKNKKEKAFAALIGKVISGNEESLTDDMTDAASMIITHQELNLKDVEIIVHENIKE